MLLAICHDAAYAAAFDAADIRYLYTMLLGAMPCYALLRHAITLRYDDSLRLRHAISLAAGFAAMPCCLLTFIAMPLRCCHELLLPCC